MLFETTLEIGNDLIEVCQQVTWSVKENPCKLYAWETRMLQGVQAHTQVSNHPTPSLPGPSISELQHRHLTTSVPVQPSLGSQK